MCPPAHLVFFMTVLLASAGLTEVGAAQTRVPTDAKEGQIRPTYVEERVTNPTRKGSPSILLYVAFPTRDGINPVPKQGGYPVIVALHGAGVGAGILWEHAKRMIARGYIVVAPTGQALAPQTQVYDALALPQVLARLNRDEDSPYFGLLDLRRLGLCGHSMGGGNTIRVLAEQSRTALHPYQAGFCFAPWDGHTLPGTGSPYIKLFAAKVRKPLGIVHGAGDMVLPARRCALGYFEAMQGKTEASKLLYVLNGQCDHHNVGFPGGRNPAAPNRRIFEFCSDLAIAFFDDTLLKKPQALGEIVDRKTPWRFMVKRDP